MGTYYSSNVLKYRNYYLKICLKIRENMINAKNTLYGNPDEVIHICIHNRRDYTKLRSHLLIWLGQCDCHSRAHFEGFINCGNRTTTATTTKKKYKNRSRRSLRTHKKARNTNHFSFTESSQNGCVPTNYWRGNIYQLCCYLSKWIECDWWFRNKQKKTKPNTT